MASLIQPNGLSLQQRGGWPFGLWESLVTFTDHLLYLGNFMHIILLLPTTLQ